MPRNSRQQAAYNEEPSEEKWSSEGERDDSDLVELNARLSKEVDEDLFVDPRHFKALDRVIDVLGSEMIDLHSDFERLSQSNPAFRALKKQMEVVEDAIEHIAVVRCTELNTSVVQVGRVARQFTETMNRVRCLRRQVHDIRESLGAAQANPNEPTTPGTNGFSNGTGPVSPQGATTGSAAMSLRELWLKKLECEAVLSLLSKLEVIRTAPAEFDALVHSRSGGPCRIGAAVVLLCNALNIMFSDDVAQVQALHKILLEITSRQQRAEEIIWDTLHDVLFLRTGNGAEGVESSRAAAVPSANKSSGASVGHSVSSESKRRGGRSVNRHGMSNPFYKANVRYAQDDDDDDSVDTLGSGASLFSRDDSSVASSQKSNPNASSKKQSSMGMGYPSMMENIKSRMMIPYSVIDAELDLEADERRCLEESALSGVSNINASWDSVFAAHSRSNRPRYADHVLALRILVECLARLGKVDDIERMINEELEREIRKIAQREQARTFARLEKQRAKPRRKAGDDLRDFRRHMTGLLSAFGCVMIRLSHLAQIVRHRIRSDPTLLRGSSNPSSALHSVLVTAYASIQKEIKGFLRACLKDQSPSADGSSEAATTVGSHESGLFSLGLGSSKQGEGYSKYGSLTASRASTLELPAEGFVVKVLLPMTNTSPQPRYALSFRRSLARWTDENEDLKKQLALVTGEDTTSPSYNAVSEEAALDFLDNFTKQHLLPELQDDAVNETVHALERDDAFDPVLDRNLYARSSSNEPQDVDMCIACQALYRATTPLFTALHRLPAGGEMYLPVVAVLEHVMLTFTSRVKQRVGQLTANKTALRFLLDSSAGGKDKAFLVVMERRKAYAQLLRAYADGDMLQTAVEESGMMNKDPNLVPLSPPATDTKAKNGPGDESKLSSGVSELDLAGGVEREEQNLKFELAHLQSILEFDKDFKMKNVVVCKDEELMKAATLAHSLLKLASLFESRLKVKSSGSYEKPLTSTRALREAIKTIKTHGIKMAKFCRVDLILQSATRLSKICKSSTIVAKDAVRLPSCVHDLGEYLTGASDNLREAGGSAVTAYTFSALEQYIPLFLMQTVRVIAKGQGIIAKSPLSLNGIEALDRSGSVLYRDLKGATSFDNSFWDDELAAVSFERSASFMAMMELEMDELEAYFRANQNDFSDKDFELMFAMNAPRRRGDIGRYNMMKKRKK